MAIVALTMSCSISKERLRQGLTMLLIAFLTSMASERCLAQEQGCYAFEREGAILSKCKGKLTATRDLDIQGFALSPDQRYLVLRRIVEIKRDAFTSEGDDRSVVIDLQSGSEKKPGLQSFLFFASCGKLLAKTGDNVIVEVATGSRLQRAPYSSFRCSSDGNTILGYIPEKHSIMMGSPPEKLIYRVPASPISTLLFDISPNGAYVAYSDGANLCISERGKAPSCTEAGVTDSLSISNGGAAIFSMGTEQECFYKDMWHFSTVHKPHYNGRDACLGVGVWRANMKEPNLVENEARNPQWIEDSTPFFIYRLKALGTPSAMRGNAAKTKE